MAATINPHVSATPGTLTVIDSMEQKPPLSVKFSDTTEISPSCQHEEPCVGDSKEKQSGGSKQPVSATHTGTPHSGRKNRRNKSAARLREQQKAEEEARDQSRRVQQNIEHVKKFSEQLTPSLLASFVKQYVANDMKLLGIRQPLPGVPINGQVPVFPISFCDDCIETIASYFENENMAGKVVNREETSEGDGKVFIDDKKKLATLFLLSLRLHFYDHVTVQAFNSRAMEQGGPLYGAPLSLACMADAADHNSYGSHDLYEKLAGRESLCASFSTGVVMQHDKSNLTAVSDNGFKTHGQVVEENIDLNTIRTGCSCMKSEKWLVNRSSYERDVEKLLNGKGVTRKEESASWSNWLWCKGNEMEEKEGEEEEKEMEEKERQEDDESDPGPSFVGSVPECETDLEFASLKSKMGEITDVLAVREDSIFRPSCSVKHVEKEEDFESEFWSKMRSRSTCLAVCRHNTACVVNAMNKAKILASIALVNLPPGQQDREMGVASTTPGEFFTVAAYPGQSLIFSLGSTLYESLARRLDEEDGCYNESLDGCSVSSSSTAQGSVAGEDMVLSLAANHTAKVYTNVHTVAAPFYDSLPVSHINHQSKNGYYKTFRVCIPGNFSGMYNDESLLWRSHLYSSFTESAVKAECEGDRKSHGSFLSERCGEIFIPWPSQRPVKIESGVVYDDSGDMSGNYLTHWDGIGNEERAAVAAHAAYRGLCANRKTIQMRLGSLLTGCFKDLLVDLEQHSMEQQEAEGNGELTKHEQQKMRDISNKLHQNISEMAATIDRYERCQKQLERDIGVMNKYASLYLKGYNACLRSITDDVDALYM